MASWQPGGAGPNPATFGGVLPSLAGPPTGLITRPPPRVNPTVAPVPIGPPGETGTPPRAAFASERTRIGEDVELAVRPVAVASRPQRFGKASMLAACVLEAAVVVPTAHMEVHFAEKTNEPWSLFLRILIAAVRLYPVVMPCLPSLRRAAASCSAYGRQSPPCRRFLAFFCVTFAVLFCPEVRWGVAITLDMWYLLTTPLNKGLTEVPCVILLAVNIILCFVDTLTLIMMLAVKSSEELDPPPERESFARPKPIRLGDSQDGSKFDPTCIICLSDFKSDDEVVQLPCDHTFHTECITKWLSRSRHCPLRCPPVVLPPRTSRLSGEAQLSSFSQAGERADP